MLPQWSKNIQQRVAPQAANKAQNAFNNSAKETIRQMTTNAEPATAIQSAPENSGFFIPFLQRFAATGPAITNKLLLMKRNNNSPNWINT